MREGEHIMFTRDGGEPIRVRWDPAVDLPTSPPVLHPDGSSAYFSIPSTSPGGFDVVAAALNDDHAIVGQSALDTPLWNGNGDAIVPFADGTGWLVQHDHYPDCSADLERTDRWGNPIAEVATAPGRPITSMLVADSTALLHLGCYPDGRIGTAEFDESGNFALSSMVPWEPFYGPGPVTSFEPHGDHIVMEDAGGAMLVFDLATSTGRNVGDLLTPIPNGEGWLVQPRPEGGCWLPHEVHRVDAAGNQLAVVDGLDGRVRDFVVSGSHAVFQVGCSTTGYQVGLGEFDEDGNLVVIALSTENDNAQSLTHASFEVSDSEVLIEYLPERFLVFNLDTSELTDVGAEPPG